MKLSLALSALLLGGAVMMSGCGSSSSSTPSGDTTNTVTDTDTSENSVPVFTTAMLAGKTFYGYGIYADASGVTPEYRIIATFNADASQLNAHNFPDAEDTFSVDVANSIVDGKMHWSADGIVNQVATAIQILDDGSFFMIANDSLHPDPYPVLFSATELADKGQAAFETFMAAQALSKETMTANTWYGVDWAEYDLNDQTGNLNCQALWLFNEDDTIDASYMDNGQLKTIEDAGTYLISDNKLEADYTVGEDPGHSTLTPIMIFNGEIIWDDKTAYFKNRDDAVAFVQLLGGGETCYGIFPE
jgi:hypothetical protein